MADQWKLVTPTGDVQLNASFSAPQYEPGGVDRGAARRRDGLTTYQRVGDGLRTPGPLRLNGRVWDDSLNITAMLDELDEIKEAVAACTQVVRTTTAGTYTYDRLAGGPPPEVTPDGLGGFEVKIELWPGRAAATFVPTAAPVDLLAASVAFESFQSGASTRTITVPGGASAGQLLIAAFYAGAGSITSVPAGFVNLNGLGDLAAIDADGDYKVFAFRKAVTSPLSTFDVDVSGFYGLAYCAVLGGEGMNTADVSATIVRNTDSGEPVGVTGTASVGGKQIFIGAVTSFGIN